MKMKNSHRWTRCLVAMALMCPFVACEEDAPVIERPKVYVKFVNHSDENVFISKPKYRDEDTNIFLEIAYSKWALYQMVHPHKSLYYHITFLEYDDTLKFLLFKQSTIDQWYMKELVDMNHYDQMFLVPYDSAKKVLVTLDYYDQPAASTP